MWGFKKKAKAGSCEEFWKWFLDNEEMLLYFERDRERIFDLLAKQLQKVNRELCFEFGPTRAKREFVISAGGIRSAFPSVVALTNAAPNLPRWNVTAFRPRRITLNTIEFRNRHVDPNDVKFMLLVNPEEGKVGLKLFIPGMNEHDTDLRQIGYLLLDEVLGEYDVETRVGLISMLEPEATTDGSRYPISELAASFDDTVAKLEGRSSKPS